MMILTSPEEDNDMILIKKESKIRNPSVNSGKYLLKCCNTNLYKEGERLNQIYYLIQGKISLHKEGRFNKVHKLLQVNHGTFLGLSSLYDSSEISHSATVRGKSLLLVIPTFQFKDFLNRWPVFKEQIIYQLINQLELTEKKIS